MKFHNSNKKALLLFGGIFALVHIMFFLGWCPGTAHGQTMQKPPTKTKRTLCPTMAYIKISDSNILYLKEVVSQLANEKRPICQQKLYKQIVLTVEQTYRLITMEKNHRNLQSPVAINYKYAKKNMVSELIYFGKPAKVEDYLLFGRFQNYQSRPRGVLGEIRKGRIVIMRTCDGKSIPYLRIEPGLVFHFEPRAREPCNEPPGPPVHEVFLYQRQSLEREL